MVVVSMWEEMAADLAEIRAENPASITIRRAGVTLSPQTVRIARLEFMGRRADAGGLEASTGMVVVSGLPAMDVQPADRFTVGANVYEVVFVRPNRRASTQAEARLVQ